MKMQFSQVIFRNHNEIYVSGELTDILDGKFVVTGAHDAAGNAAGNVVELDSSEEAAAISGFFDYWENARIEAVVESSTTNMRRRKIQMQRCFETTPCNLFRNALREIQKRPDGGSEYLGCGVNVKTPGQTFTVIFEYEFGYFFQEEGTNRRLM